MKAGLVVVVGWALAGWILFMLIASLALYSQA